MKLVPQVRGAVLVSHLQAEPEERASVLAPHMYRRRPLRKPTKPPLPATARARIESCSWPQTPRVLPLPSLLRASAALRRLLLGRTIGQSTGRLSPIATASFDVSSTPPSTYATHGRYSRYYRARHAQPRASRLACQMPTSSLRVCSRMYNGRLGSIGLSPFG